jgi:hypothetical protein
MVLCNSLNLVSGIARVCDISSMEMHVDVSIFGSEFSVESYYSAVIVAGRN